MFNYHLIIILCVLSLVLSVIGAIAAEQKIILRFKELDSRDSSISDLVFIGLNLVEILPVLMLILTIIVIKKYL